AGAGGGARRRDRWRRCWARARARARARAGAWAWTRKWRGNRQRLLEGAAVVPAHRERMVPYRRVGGNRSRHAEAATLVGRKCGQQLSPALELHLSGLVGRKI